MMIGIVSESKRNMDVVKAFLGKADKTICVKESDFDIQGEIVEFKNCRICVLHGGKKEKHKPLDDKINIVVMNRQSDPQIFWRDGVMFLTPGSGTKTTAALLHIKGPDDITAEIRTLDLDFGEWHPEQILNISL